MNPRPSGVFGRMLANRTFFGPFGVYQAELPAHVLRVVWFVGYNLFWWGRRRDFHTLAVV